MIRAPFGPTTAPQVLRKSLDQSMETHKEIAQRIADLMKKSDASAGDPTAKAEVEADLSGTMSELADNQIRYETEAKLLQLVYQGLRRAIRTNG